MAAEAPSGLQPLSQDEIFARFDYAESRPFFDREQWETQGWEPVITFHRLVDDKDFGHAISTIRDNAIVITQRELPIAVDYPSDGVSSWYTYTDHENPNETIEQETKQVCEEFLHSALLLQERGLIAIDYPADMTPEALENPTD